MVRGSNRLSVRVPGTKIKRFRNSVTKVQTKVIDRRGHSHNRGVSLPDTMERITNRRPGPHRGLLSSKNKVGR